MEIHGFKSFANDGTNLAGEVMPVGDYHCDGEIIYKKNGYHLAERIENTFRYAGENPIVAQVIGYGSVVEGNSLEDKYFDYDGLYVASDIKIVKYLTHEELFEYAKTLTYYRLERFLQANLLTDEELSIIASMSYSNDRYVRIFKELREENKQKVKVK